MLIELLVDGSPIELWSVMFHYQEDPFPGGLIYEIRAQDPGLLIILEPENVEGERGPLSRREVDSVFMALEGFRSLRALNDPAEREKAQSRTLKYWFNTIERMTIRAGDIFLRGVASPHVE